MVDQRSPPWQYEWKRPQWEEVDVEESVLEGIPIDSSSAHLFPGEIPLLPSSRAGSSVLTATLYSKDGEVGDVIVFDLASEKDALKRRVLRWPQSAFTEGNGVVGLALCRKPTKSKEVSAVDAMEILTMMSLGLPPEEVKREEKDREIRVSRSSMESNEPGQELNLACLATDGVVHMYSPLEFLDDHAEKKQDPYDDKLGSAFASLLLGPSLQKQIEDMILPLSSPSSSVPLSLHLQPRKIVFNKENIQDTPSPFPIFSQWGGANKNKKEAEKKKRAGQGNFLPPFLQHLAQQPEKEKKSSKRDQGAPSERADTKKDAAGAPIATAPVPPGSQRSAGSSTRSANQFPQFLKQLDPTKRDEGEIDIWDSSRWNPIVEPSTASFRTLRNVPEKIKTVFDFVAVYGRGTRLRRARDMDSRARQEFSERTMDSMRAASFIQTSGSTRLATVPEPESKKPKEEALPEGEGVTETTQNEGGRVMEGTESEKKPDGWWDASDSKLPDIKPESPVRHAAYGAGEAWWDAHEELAPETAPTRGELEPPQSVEDLATDGKEKDDKKSSKQRADGNEEHPLSEPTRNEDPYNSLDDPEAVETLASEPDFIEEVGGFIVFISIYHGSETRTIFLPFVPKDIFPVIWGNMYFVVVLGENAHGPDSTPYSVVVRVDSGDDLYIKNGSAPRGAQGDDLHSPVEGYEEEDAEELCPVKRFQPIPLILPINEPILMTSASALSTSPSSPPGVVLMYSEELKDSRVGVEVALNTFQSVEYVSSDNFSIHPRYRKEGGRAVAVITKQKAGRRAAIPEKMSYNEVENAWSKSGQGWTIVGFGGTNFFVCWEGATEFHGAYIKQLHSIPTTNPNLTSLLLPTNPLKRMKMAVDEGIYEETGNEVVATDTDLHLPFTSPYRLPRALKRFENIADGPKIDDVMLTALDSISNLNFDSSMGRSLSLIPSYKPRPSFNLSHTEKSSRLLQHCESWAILDDTVENRANFEIQGFEVLVHCGRSQMVLSLRQASLVNGVAAPFDQILAWLSHLEEYFTAASVALNLLRDVETLRELRRLRDHENFEEDRANLEGLLDGVVPLYPSSLDKKGPVLLPKQSVVTQLADMTIGCLVRGGLAMSKPLEGFLRRNKNYDPARTSLVLVAAFAKCVSDEKDVVEGAMGAGFRLTADPDPEDLLWGLRGLLEVGTARGYLAPALILLNATMPNELRCRKHPGRLPSMKLSKAMISTIISFSPDAATLLLGLSDDESRTRYWQSLSHETRLEFSLIKIDDRCPLLHQSEVRVWALQSLQSCIDSTSASLDTGKILPSTWLQGLCYACFSNAGCAYQQLCSGKSDHPEFHEDAQKHLEDVKRAQKALVPASGCGGLDFDLIIPSLLLLETRRVLWHDDASVSTDTVLDAACYLAGRHTKEMPLFTFDGPTVMRQCALLGNVSAGAYLIGGKEGLILKCCDILMKGASVSMDAAESFLLGTSIEGVSVRGSSGTDEFILTDGHKHILLLLSEHVLNVRTFGEFHPDQLRGRVDPIFAARTCFRTWLRMSETSGATAWLVNWLRARLSMTSHGVSPLRLACAAITRVLVWPTSDDDTVEPDSREILANAMKIESNFLVGLAQSCCGLIEAIPVAEADAILKEATPSFEQVSPMVGIGF